LASQSASEKEIKKQWKKLTLSYHPDKVKLSGNQTMEDATSHYVELGKAYKALTDEEVRNNFIQYGHPDGKQSFSIGIALPTFIVTEGNGKYVLLVYGLLLGVLLPYIVGKWWYGTQKLTKERVLVATANKLFREFEETMDKGAVVSALSVGDEYKNILKGSKADHGLGKIEKAILEGGDSSSTVAGLSQKDSAKLQSTEGVRRKTLALLWAYLGRIDLGDKTLDDGLCT
jgi:translocation protein SEC63